MKPAINDDDMQWGLALEGPDLTGLAHWLRDNVWQTKLPLEVVVDYAKKKVTSDWLERWGSTNKSVAAYWDSKDSEMLVMHRRVVMAKFPFHRSVSKALAWLASAPFEVASFATIHPEWEEIDPDYIPPSFSNNHFHHGWGCAFKGAGHMRLVSRRWLDYGPWKLWRRGSDISLVQFHSLDVDARTALAQAKPGHLRMGISDSGGFLQKPYVYKKAPSGLYSADERMLRIVVLGRDLPSVELLDACAARSEQALGPEKPLERIAYVFMEEDVAQRYLHKLWLRELECWTMHKGVEVRLDSNYPPPREMGVWD